MERGNSIKSMNKPFLFSIILHLTVGLIVIFGLPSLAKKHEASAPIAVEFVTGAGFLEKKTDQTDLIKSLIEETTAPETSEEVEQELSVEEKLPPLPAPKAEIPDQPEEVEPELDVSEKEVEPEDDKQMTFDPDADVPDDDQVQGAADAAKETQKSEEVTADKQVSPEQTEQNVLTTQEGESDFIAKLIDEETKQEETKPKSEEEVESKSVGEGEVADVNPTETKKEEKPVSTPIPKPKPREIAKLKKPKPQPVKPKKEEKKEPEEQQKAAKESTALNSIISSVLSKEQQLETANEVTKAQVQAPEEQVAGQSGGVSLQSNEITRVIRKIEGSWITPPGLNGQRAPTVRIRLVLDLDGNVLVADILDPKQDQTFQTAAESMLRAVWLASPLPFPADKYDSWQTTILKFNLQELISG